MQQDISSDDSARRGRIVGLCGWAIVALSAGSALLPLLGHADAKPVIGTMLVVAGIFEAISAWQRHDARILALLAALLTIAAGLLFATQAAGHLLPALYIVAGWLAGRALLFFATAGAEHGSVRRWTIVSAVTDAALAVLLIIGISIATLVVALFGETSPMIASFAWVLAASFVTTGLMLVETANCARREEV
ncbi:hypothetical protein [Sphingomonas jaspsi]|uniref:hypothetical protein n=1 Tax=Sphingomonas jaspsi TaxID=392409 RepID=UPI0004B22448|nr:hypothetical protein [Sphingomonas jaspsi]